MQPKEWVKKLSEFDNNSEFVRDFNFQLKQNLINNVTETDIVDFYEKSLQLCYNSEEFNSIHIKSTLLFEKELKNKLTKAIKRAQNDSRIKAIHLEYFYDGGGACSCDISLCQNYSKVDDEWGAEFDSKDFFPGPKVNEFFDYPDFFDFPQYIVASEYTEAVLLSAVIKVIKKVNKFGIPFGFAGHQSQILHINTEAKKKRDLLRWIIN